MATFLCPQQAVCTVLFDSEKHSDKDLMPISNNFTAVEKLVTILERIIETTDIVSA